MKGILLDKVGGDYHLVDNLDKPKPGMGQLLVKSLVAGLNPVEGFQRSGILVDSWPMVLGCDASGVIVEIGADVAKFKEGDAVFACTRLGAKGFGTFQEYFLVDAHLAFKKPDNISSEEAATIGVGVFTAGLALFGGLKLSLENKANNSEWIVILGSAGAVGQYAVQLAKLCGFKVLAFCSPSNGELVKSLGADATLSHKIAVNDQLKGIASITGGNFVRLFDASAMAGEFGMQALADHGAKDRTKYFATTNDWEPVRARNGIEVDMVALGLIGKSGIAKAEIVNSAIESFIPKFEEHFKNGGLKPMKYERVGNVGVEEVLKGLNAFNTRKSDGKKLIVRLAKE